MKNENKTANISLKKIAAMGILAALAIILVMIVHFPLIPGVSFLEYDPADIPIYISTFVFGPISGLVITVVVSLIQGFTVSAGSGIYGIIMHMISTGAFVLVSGLVYKYKKDNIGVVFGLIIGVIATTLIMIPANLFITPYYTGMPINKVKSMLLPAIIPFNLIKQIINAVLTFVLYKATFKILKKWIY